jgi:mono/diheme cytochrome c family protein
MANKYRGYCADCHQAVGPRHGELRKESGKWVIRCQSSAARSVARVESQEDYPCTDRGYEDQCARACGFDY